MKSKRRRAPTVARSAFGSRVIMAIIGALIVSGLAYALQPDPQLKTSRTDLQLKTVQPSNAAPSAIPRDNIIAEAVNQTDSEALITSKAEMYATYFYGVMELGVSLRGKPGGEIIESAWGSWEKFGADPDLQRSGMDDRPRIMSRKLFMKSKDDPAFYAKLKSFVDKTAADLKQNARDVQQAEDAALKKL